MRLRHLYAVLMRSRNSFIAMADGVNRAAIPIYIDTGSDRKETAPVSIITPTGEIPWRTSKIS
jgi:hypothetical protein